MWQAIVHFIKQSPVNLIFNSKQRLKICWIKLFQLPTTQKQSGAVAISHDWSGEIDNDFERITKTFAGFAGNPNIFTTVALTIGTDVEAGIIERAKKFSPIPLVEVKLSDAGSMFKLVTTALEKATELAEQAAAQSRVPAPWSSVVLGLECGGSDAYSGITANPALGIASDRFVEFGATSILAETMEILGAEHLLAARALDPKVGAQIIEVVARYERSINYEGIDIRGAQPSRGNIEGGLSTLEEKSLGAAKKAGNAPFTGVLEFADRPTAPGLYFMDTPGHDIEQLTGFAAADVNITVFTTGRGTPTGSAVIPTIKVATNSEMGLVLTDLIDLNAGTISDGTQTLEEVGQILFDEIVKVANGQLTKAEHGNSKLKVPLTLCKASGFRTNFCNESPSGSLTFSLISKNLSQAAIIKVM
ncbi:MAG: altronate dehydratase [Actinobacteria bacterium]|nr:altronate dehydratase [Actinomycetota bacterium]